MQFAGLLRVVDHDPVFETGLLLAGTASVVDVERQLSRWKRSNRVVQIRRGLYALATPYRKAEPHSFLVANRLVPGSYVSCQAALAWHGLIPEHVAVVTSVSTRGTRRFDTSLGSFLFRHVKPQLLFGYRVERVVPGQEALVALPEKALLDLVHLEPAGDSRPFLEGLRLQHLDQLDLELLHRAAQSAQSAKLVRAASVVAALAEAERTEYEEQ
ncbi:MAG: type IV toxin-antitoxin system AbiEi family antitoxin domain-containing protein [Vicinamibacteraceae bacterium]